MCNSIGTVKVEARFAPESLLWTAENLGDFIIWDCFVIFLLNWRITEMNINNSALQPGLQNLRALPLPALDSSGFGSGNSLNPRDPEEPQRQGLCCFPRSVTSERLFDVPGSCSPRGAEMSQSPGPAYGQASWAAQGMGASPTPGFCFLFLVLFPEK